MALKVRPLTAQEADAVKRFASSRTAPHRVVQRARNRVRRRAAPVRRDGLIRDAFRITQNEDVSHIPLHQQSLAWGTSRRSRLFPGPFLVHADLHNHTQLSDGDGDPALLFP